MTRIKTEDVERPCVCPERLVDMACYGIHACKDGKRIAPEDLYMEPTIATEDVVERLRAPDCWKSVSSEGAENIDGAPVEAADTIERLSVALRNMLALIEGNMMPMSKDEYREFKAARAALTPSVDET